MKENDCSICLISKYKQTINKHKMILPYKHNSVQKKSKSHAIKKKEFTEIITIYDNTVI